MRKPTDRLLKLFLKQRIDAGESGVWTEEEIERLRSQAQNCTCCSLGLTRLNACFGDGNHSARLMFIGEGPGFDEDHRGEVFIGRAGKLLTKIIESAIGVRRNDVYITNIVKCHPMKDPSDPEKRGNDRPPTRDELSACINRFLYKQIQAVSPEVIVTLGGPATKTILKTDQGITALRGKPVNMVFGKHTALVIPTYHPAYLLRNPSKKRETFEDTKLIRSILEIP